MIKVALERVPMNVHYLLFLVSVYSPGMSFANVRSCFVRMVHRKKVGKNPELARLNLSGGPGEAMALACLVRRTAVTVTVHVYLYPMCATIECPQNKNAAVNKPVKNLAIT